jgi:hypothetical protein
VDAPDELEELEPELEPPQAARYRAALVLTPAVMNLRRV